MLCCFCSSQLLTDEAMTWRLKVKSYLSDTWNRIDQAMYAMLLLAVILRYTLTDDYNFEWARNVYAMDLVMFYVRILQFYFVEKRLGPKVIMIRRMVFVTFEHYQKTNDGNLAEKWRYEHFKSLEHISNLGQMSPVPT